MNKADIRALIRRLKAELTENDKTTAALRAFDTLRTTPQYREAKDILIYYSLPDELSTIEFLKEYYREKNFYLPRVNGSDIDILPYEPSNINTGAFNIQEPGGMNIVDINKIDLIIVPAIAYDKYGNRVGRGKGYYDRLLCRTKATKVGICYNFQLIDRISDSNKFDIPVDLIITDRGQIIPSKSVLGNNMSHQS